MISFTQKGDFNKLTKFLKNSSKNLNISGLDKFGKEGVAALASVTPVDTGETASCWYYKIQKTKTSISINFCNSNISEDVPIAIILQYGHVTNNKGWVEGYDYINPSIKPIFEKITKQAWKEVSNR